MGYLHIDNLYKNQAILNFRECYALEKVHGTSAHVGLTHPEGKAYFFSGGEAHERFVGLFNKEGLEAALIGVCSDAPVVVYGEAYGGKQQGMSATYGPELHFIAFDVKIGDSWLDVPDAEDVVNKLGLEFVPWVKIPTDLSSIDAERDRDSIVAKRRLGIGASKLREGVVLRPLNEMLNKTGGRVIAKHKRDEFMETATPHKVDVNKIAAQADAVKVAEEWVTDMRLAHVLDKLPTATSIEHTKQVIDAMWEDVEREGKDEIVVSDVVRAKCAQRTAQLWKRKLNDNLKESA
jgi:hypothetical protein